MSNFDGFCKDQISWKLAQREFFVLVFYYKNSFYSRQSRKFLNTFWTTFFGWPLITSNLHGLPQRRTLELRLAQSWMLANTHNATCTTQKTHHWPIVLNFYSGWRIWDPGGVCPKGKKKFQCFWIFLLCWLEGLYTFCKKLSLVVCGSSNLFHVCVT